MTRRLRLPERQWTVVQCADGKEYLIPFGFEGDVELNCEPLPILDLLDAYRKKNTCASTTAPRKPSAT